MFTEYCILQRKTRKSINSGVSSYSSCGGSEINIIDNGKAVSFFVKLQGGIDNDTDELSITTDDGGSDYRNFNHTVLLYFVFIPFLLVSLFFLFLSFFFLLLYIYILIYDAFILFKDKYFI